jgi:GAF domain-containing protein
MRAGRTHLTDDLSTETAFPGERMLFQAGLRSRVNVPLVHAGRVMGALSLASTRPAAFDRHQVSLLEQVAGPLAIAIENARLFERERVQRQWLETLYRIGQAINTTLDANAILDRLTDEAMRATHATHGSALIARPDLNRFERLSLRGYSPELAEAARITHLPLDHGVNSRAYAARRAIYLADVRQDADYFPLVPDTRSELAVPLIRGGQVVGNLDLQSPEVDAFHDIDLDFLRALTDQVAVALENARLFEETHRRLEELAVISQVALVGAAGRPFDETVERATQALTQLWPDAFLGFLFVDEATRSLRRILILWRAARDVGLVEHPARPGHHRLSSA